MNYFKR